MPIIIFISISDQFVLAPCLSPIQLKVRRDKLKAKLFQCIVALHSFPEHYVVSEEVCCSSHWHNYRLLCLLPAVCTTSIAYSYHKLRISIAYSR